MFLVLSWIFVRPRDRPVLHFFFTVLDVTNAFVETCFPQQLQLPLRFPPAGFGAHDRRNHDAHLWRAHVRWCVRALIGAHQNTLPPGSRCVCVKLHTQACAVTPQTSSTVRDG